MQDSEQVFDRQPPLSGLRVLEIEDAVIRTEYRLACLKDREESPKIRAFLNIAGHMNA